MSTATSNQSFSFTDEGFSSLLETLNEPAWVTDQRKAAWAKFNELAWPNNREEEWMRTDIRLFKLDKFSMKADSSTDNLPPTVFNLSLIHISEPTRPY